MWPFSLPQTPDEELLVLLLEFFSLLLLRISGEALPFFEANSATFRLLSEKAFAFFLHCEKNSLLFRKSIFLIGNYLCKGVRGEALFDLSALVGHAFAALRFDQYFAVYPHLIWLLRIAFAFLGCADAPPPPACIGRR